MPEFLLSREGLQGQSELSKHVCFVWQSAFAAHLTCLLTVRCYSAQDISAAQATRKLQDAAGQTSGNQLLVLLDAPLVQRASICGNQVCEPGERTIAGPNNLGAPGPSQLLCHSF